MNKIYLAGFVIQTYNQDGNERAILRKNNIALEFC